MKKLYKNGLLARDGAWEQADMLVENGIISCIAPSIEAECEVEDIRGRQVLPAFIDEHTHGAAGYEFASATLSEMRVIMDFYVSHNVGTVFPTLMTDSEQSIEKQAEIIFELSKEYPQIKGIHLEGPFLSVRYKGAMPERYLVAPDLAMFERIQKCAGGLIRLITVAPETKGAAEFIASVVKQGVRVNLGHSGADYATVMRCIDAGANGFTHTFNAMRPLHHREANICTAALLSDCYCELICDGRHVVPEMVRLLHRTKGTDKIVLITDSIMAAGLPDGRYSLGDSDVTVTDGDAFITGTDTRAGSTCTAPEAFDNFCKFTGLPPEQSIAAMTENPARHMGLFDKTGSLSEGKLAEFWIK